MDVKQSNRWHGPKWLYWLFSSLIILTAGCISETPEVQFVPPGGQYLDTQSIELIIQGAVEIYYTTDGTVPTPDCLQYFPGGSNRIEMDHAGSVRVLYRKIDGPEWFETDAQYIIENGAGAGSDPVGNRAVVETYDQFERESVLELGETIWGGPTCIPVYHCTKDVLIPPFLNEDSQRTWFLCRDSAGNTEVLSVQPTTGDTSDQGAIDDCKADPTNSWVRWTLGGLEIEGPLYFGPSWFEYHNWTRTLNSQQWSDTVPMAETQYEGITVTLNGTSFGRYNQYLDGGAESEPTIKILTDDGAGTLRSATMRYVVDISGGAKVGGNYHVNCSGSDQCSNAEEEYLVSPDGSFRKAVDSVSSCESPWFNIASHYWDNTHCIQNNGELSLAAQAICDTDDNQKWYIDADPNYLGTGTAFNIRSLQESPDRKKMCIEGDHLNDSGLFQAFRMAECRTGAPFQQYKFIDRSSSAKTVDIWSPALWTADDKSHCMAVDWVRTATDRLWAMGCDLGGSNIGFGQGYFTLLREGQNPGVMSGALLPAE